MAGFLPNKAPVLLLLAALAIASASAPAAVRTEQASAPSVSRAGQDKALAREIVQLFKDDQALLAELQNAKNDPAFRQTLETYVERSKVKEHNPNFYDSVVYGLWAEAPDAPEIVRRYMRFRKAADARVQSIVAEYGWPQ